MVYILFLQSINTFLDPLSLFLDIKDGIPSALVANPFVPLRNASSDSALLRFDCVNLLEIKLILDECE